MFDGTLALVGAGNMGGAMLNGWLAGGVAPARITVIDPGLAAERRGEWEGRGVRFLATAEAPDILVLAVKPQLMDAVMPAAVAMAGEDTLVVSVAAGVTIATLAAAFGDTPIIRAMPNTPAQVARGVTVCCPTAGVTAAQRGATDALMRAIGHVEWIDDETLMDAVTGVSGSGPAYAFLLAETLAEAGEAAGLPPDLALRLARHTVAGAGELLARSLDTPATLRRNVTSPGGTTAAALEVLMDSNGFAPLVKEAVERAARRSKELSAS